MVFSLTIFLFYGETQEAGDKIQEASSVKSWVSVWCFSYSPPQSLWFDFRRQSCAKRKRSGVENVFLFFSNKYEYCTRIESVTATKLVIS